jgi:hypothetical protein
MILAFNTDSLSLHTASVLVWPIIKYNNFQVWRLLLVFHGIDYLSAEHGDSTSLCKIHSNPLHTKVQRTIYNPCLSAILVSEANMEQLTEMNQKVINSFYTFSTKSISRSILLFKRYSEGFVLFCVFTYCVRIVIMLGFEIQTYSHVRFVNLTKWKLIPFRHLITKWHITIGFTNSTSLRNNLLTVFKKNFQFHFPTNVLRFKPTNPNDYSFKCLDVLFALFRRNEKLLLTEQSAAPSIS